MTEILPTPPIPPDVDLRGFPYTPMFRSRLFGSDFHAHASDSAWRAGVTLWLKSWDQMPAGSLPDDEVSLCRLAELGRDLKAWSKVREWALHGWLKHSDGRLYHKVVAEGVNEAWASKAAQTDRTAAARAARARQRLLQASAPPTTEDVATSVTENVTEAAAENVTAAVTENVTGSNRNREGKRDRKVPDSPVPNGTSESGADGAAPRDLGSRVFNDGLRWLSGATGKSEAALRPVLGRMCRDHGNGAVIDAIGAAQREGVLDPIAWMTGRFRSADRPRSRGSGVIGGVIPMHPGAGG